MRIVAFEDGAGTSVPWLKDAIRDGFVANGDKRLIWKVSIHETGALCITDDFKWFVYANSQMYHYLVEALDYYCSDDTEDYALFAIVARGRNLAVLGIDDERIAAGYWKRAKNVYTFDSSTQVSKRAVNINPLMPMRPSVQESPSDTPETPTTPPPQQTSPDLPPKSRTRRPDPRG